MTMKKSNVGGGVTLAEVKLNPVNEMIGWMTESPPGLRRRAQTPNPTHPVPEKGQSSSAKLGTMHDDLEFDIWSFSGG
jgi:hypothetical protein